MTIRDIVKEKQPREYLKLTKIAEARTLRPQITEQDIKDCMKHDAYRRKGGAIKQVRW